MDNQEIQKPQLFTEINSEEAASVNGGYYGCGYYPRRYRYRRSYYGSYYYPRRYYYRSYYYYPRYYSYYRSSYGYGGGYGCW